MQGKLMTKSKVIETKRSKSQLFRRRVKPERESTAQRWSRRIRSLPPIPINVLKPRRKIKKKAISPEQERYTSTSFLEEVRKENFQQNVNKERRESVFVNKNAADEKADSVEVVRIVPVVVYVKNSAKPNKTFIPEEIRVHINDNPTCQMVSQAIDKHIHEKIQQEKLNLGRRYSRRSRTKTPYPEVENMVQAAKRKCPTRKKLLLYQ